MGDEIEERGKLPQLFDDIWSMYEKLENTTEPSNSDTVQVVSSYSPDTSDLKSPSSSTNIRKQA